MNGPHASAQSMTDVIGVFEFFLYKALAQKIEEEFNHYAQQFKDSGGNIFSQGI
jgi:hypothetical protein